MRRIRKGGNSEDFQLMFLGDVNSGGDGSSFTDGQTVVWDEAAEKFVPMTVGPANGLSQDIVNGLTGAAAPSAGNVFATLNDTLRGYKNIVVVDAAGHGDFTTLTAAMASIVDASSVNRYVVLIYGDTTEPAGVITIKESVSVVGSKKDTTIHCEGLKAGDGGALQHRAELVNLYVKKSGSGAIGFEVANADEIIVRSCGFDSFATGIKISGTSSGLMQLEDSSVSNCTLGFDVASVYALQIRGCNFYNDTTVFKFLAANHVTVTDTALETFDTAVLFDSTSSGVAALSVQFINCRFISSNGGGSYTCRVVKALAANDTYNNIVRGLLLRECSFWLTNAKYVVEVAWGGFLAGGLNRFIAALDDNYIHGESAPNHFTAWFKSDNSNIGFVHLNFGQNLAPSVPIQDGTQPLVTGYVHDGLDATAVAGSYAGAGILYGVNRWGALGSDIVRIEHGQTSLSGGTKTVTHPRVQYTTRIFLTIDSPSNPGFLYVSGITPNTSFVITSSNASDASVVGWMTID